jgi:hypothetical protein
LSAAGQKKNWLFYALKKEILEKVARCARQDKLVDHQNRDFSPAIAIKSRPCQNDALDI